MTVTPSVLDYVTHLSPPAHAILCYESAETVRQVFISYLNGGREKNETVDVLSSSRETFNHFLQCIKYSSPLKEQNPINCIEMAEFSSKTNGIDYGRSLTLMKSRLNIVKKLGFTGLRIFTIANDYLDYATPQEVLQLEQHWGQKFPYSITIMCSYDLTRAEGKFDVVLLDLLKAHGTHIFTGLAGSDEDAPQ